MENLIQSADVVSGTIGGENNRDCSVSDEKLFELCKRYGGNVLFWRQKFLGLLPEVAKRRLYEEKGFCSIFEFAKKLAGVSEEQVRVVLNLEKRFEDKRELHELLVKGKVSVNKLARIASVATIENQEILAKQVEILPCRALETFVRDQKNEDQNGLFELKIEVKSLHVSTQMSQIGLFGNNDVSANFEIKFSEEVKLRLLELQKKGININELLTEFLDKREQEIEEEKEKIVEEMEGGIEIFAEKMAKRLAKSLIEAIGDDVIVQPLGSKNPNRHVPRKIQKIIKKEFGTKCAVPTCNKPAQHLHHTLPFAISKNHDPRYLMPLCKAHHVIAHSVDQKFREVRQAVT